MGVGMTGNLHNDTRHRGHGQGTVDSGNIVVIRQCAATQRIREVVGGGTGHRLRTRHVVGCALAGHETVAGRRDRTVGQGLTVIGTGGRSRGEGHVALGHRQHTADPFAEGVAAGHIHAATHYLIAGDLVRMLSHIGLGAFHHSGQHITVLQDVRRVGESAVGQCMAGVNAGGVLGSEHNGISNLVDGQGTGRHHEVDRGEAAVGVFEVAGTQSHRVRSSQHSRHGGVVHIGGIRLVTEAGGRVQRVAADERVAVNRMVGTIVVNGFAVTGNGHRDHFRSVHRKRSVNRMRSVVVGESTDTKRVIVNTRVGHCVEVVAHHGVAFRADEADLGHLFFFVGVPVVVMGTVCRGDGHFTRVDSECTRSRGGDFVSGSYVHRTVHYDRRAVHPVEVGGIARHMGIAALDVHIEYVVVGERVGSLGDHGVTVTAVFERVAFSGQRVAVVSLVGGGGGDGQCRLRGGPSHLECIVHQSDGVVGDVTRGDAVRGHGIDTRNAGIGHATGHGGGQHVRTHQRSMGVSAIGVGRTIIRKGGTCRNLVRGRRDGHGLLVHGQAAVVSNHAVLAAHIGAIVLDGVALNLVCIRGLGSVGDGAFVNHGQHIAVAVRDGVCVAVGNIHCICRTHLHNHGGGVMGVAIVSPCPGGGGDFQGGLCAVGHRQLAVHRSDVVVVVARSDGHGLRDRALARVGDGTRNFPDNAISIRAQETGQGHCIMIGGVRVTIVSEGFVIRGDGGGLLVDLQLAVGNEVEAHVGEVGVGIGESIR